MMSYPSLLILHHEIIIYQSKFIAYKVPYKLSQLVFFCFYWTNQSSFVKIERKKEIFIERNTFLLIFWTSLPFKFVDMNIFK